MRSRYRFEPGAGFAGGIGKPPSKWVGSRVRAEIGHTIMDATGNGRPHGEIIVGGDREVVEQAKRRTFTARYKLSVLEQTEGMANGEIGAFLRREGLYSSNLSAWRKQRAEGALSGQPRKRGRKELSADERLMRRVAQLEKENAAVAEQLRKANLVVAVQKKVLSLCEQLGLLSDESSQS